MARVLGGRPIQAWEEAPAGDTADRQARHFERSEKSDGLVFELSSKTSDERFLASLEMTIGAKGTLYLAIPALRCMIDAFTAISSLSGVDRLTARPTDRLPT